MSLNIGDRVKSIKDLLRYDIVGMCGTVVRKEPGSTSVYVKFDGRDEPRYMYARELEIITTAANPTAHPTIIIHTDGITTTALLKEGKKVVKQAHAVCSPSDTYDHEYGVRLALDRLYGHEVKATPPETEWVPKVGDRVEVVTSQACYVNRGEKGTICTIDRIKNRGHIGVDMDNPTDPDISCRGDAKHGHGYWAKQEHLKPIPPAPKKPRIVKQERYSAGDKVKLIDIFPEPRKGLSWLSKSMMEYQGKTVTVIECFDGGSLGHGIVAADWLWYAPLIEGKVVE